MVPGVGDGPGVGEGSGVGVGDGCGATVSTITESVKLPVAAASKVVASIV